MYPNSNEKLKSLDIDVEQWRREIKTFVDATIKELQAINDELSFGFAGNTPRSSVRITQPSKQLGQGDSQAAGNWTKQTESSQRLESPDSPIRGNHSAPFTETQTDDRLATLKRRLAERISPTSPSNPRN